MTSGNRLSRLTPICGRSSDRPKAFLSAADSIVGVIEAAAQVPVATATHAPDRVTGNPSSPGTHGRVAHPSHDRRHAPSWHALQLRSRFEFSVSEQLQADGFEHFLPTYFERVRWTDRYKRIERPLFPGYIFARFEPSRSAEIAATRGVVHILPIDQQPVPIPDKVIDDLRRVVVSPSATPAPIIAGTQVTIQRGPFVGVTGKVASVKGKTLLTIPIPLLGRAVSVQIDAADVKATRR